jgi:hypothetical protein
MNIDKLQMRYDLFDVYLMTKGVDPERLKKFFREYYDQEFMEYEKAEFHVHEQHALMHQSTQA